MNTLSQLLSNEISYAIGWTIIHSLWQCTLIALLIAISYAFTKKASAATRYWINCLGLLSCVIASGITFYLNYYDSVSIEIVSTDYITEMSQSPQQAYVQTIFGIINQHINQIVMVWLIGFALYMSKYLAEFFYCQHIKNNHYKNPNQQLQQLFNELKNSVGITQNIQLRLSEIVDVPCVIGHFKPVVLLPASLVLGLSIKQIEVILLHELGHVRRNDYLISSLQTLVTLLYFFNPFARWISSKMDEERENACDDIAVSVSGDPLFYANTLKEFAEMKDMYSPAVAMTGRNNLLMNRIKRLFIRDASFAKTYGKAITIMVMFLLAIGFSVSGYSDEQNITDEKVSINEMNIPLKTLLEKSEEKCPSFSGKTTLKNPETIRGFSSNSISCDSLIKVIQNMDATGAEFSINETGTALKDIQKIVENKCPDIAGKIILKNPDLITGVTGERLPCLTATDILKRMDGEIVLNTEQLRQIKESGNNEYQNIVMKNNNQNKEALEKGYSANCTATFTVTKDGNPVDITPNCSSTNDDAKNHYNKFTADMIKNSKFPIKMENGKAVEVKNITIRAAWRIEKQKPTAPSNPSNNKLKKSNVPEAP